MAWETIITRTHEEKQNQYFANVFRLIFSLRYRGLCFYMNVLNHNNSIPSKQHLHK